MRRPAVSIVAAAALAFALLPGSAPAYGQTAFKVPFKFQAGGNKVSAGEYFVSVEGSSIVLANPAKGVTLNVPFVEKMAVPTPPVEGPRLVFDEVGDFQPSYTEYVTIYLLSEVWLSPQEGCLVKVTKGAHGHKVVKAEPAK